MKTLNYFTLIFLAVFVFSCEPCEKISLEVCGGTDELPKVDLIVLIDASGSMGSVASTVSNAAKASIDSALAKCPVDLNVNYLGVDGIWAATLFDSTHRNVIYQIQGGTPTLASDGPPPGYALERGANAIEDLSGLYNWRKEACRAIFYISDEELNGVSPINNFAEEDAVTAAAIAAAQLNEVTVFTNYILENNRDPSILTNYNDLTGQTGGFNLTTPNMSDVDSTLYIDLMPQIVCNACKACELKQFMSEQ
ncbi:hypothetical protein CEQ90_05660 [Lewinellaceae bacterium SD302]|nr:hypothetical protein CEQ90_05660 [Lewinellaceae bacterium SD302]